MRMLLTLLFFLPLLSSFSIPKSPLPRTFHPPLKSSNNNGEGGEKAWSKALSESVTQAPGEGEKEMKMKGLLGKSSSPKVTENQNLISWLTTSGVYLSDSSGWTVAPHPLAISTSTIDEITNESSGRGLLARRSINNGDEIISIPLELCLTKENCLEIYNQNYKLLPESVNEYIIIALSLIHLKHIKPDNVFKPYLSILPTTEDVSPTFTWLENDLKQLKGSPVISATKSLQIKLEREYNTYVVDAGLNVEDFTYERWIWAFTMLFSRAIRLRNLEAGESIALVPYVDLINHSPYSTSFVDARESGDWLFKTGKEEIILYADRGYRKMEQVYISYGEKGNGDLLLLYGFALERNPYNSVDVTVSVSGEMMEEKKRFLKLVGREERVDFQVYADRYPIEMLEYLRLMCMTEEDLGGKGLEEFDYSRTISSANEREALGAVIEAVRGQLEKYETTEEEDVDLIQDKNLFNLLSKQSRMAIRHRRNEKRLLKRTIAALEKEIKKRGLEGETRRAGGETRGVELKGDEEKFGEKRGRSGIEDRLEKMGLPVDFR
ncbi:hypothetical protein TrLO_g12087 [Triparma laevis f. longispina]|uniref:SET domain-containing protein n=1 Tax=Triparma laevis f. longispina TaxID=1714387 RepID=A0A9W7FNC8_9STRA|nr:hypothetical protein TrLO_g12087 [Triparma laevis f. longispina]